MASLNEYLAQQKAPKAFEPKPFYVPEADSLTVYFKDEESYAKRMDELLTVYLSSEKDELVGCQVKGVRRKLDLLGTFGIEIKEKNLTLGLIFLAYMATALDPTPRDTYKKLAEAARKVGAKLNTRELISP